MSKDYLKRWRKNHSVTREMLQSGRSGGDNNDELGVFEGDGVNVNISENDSSSDDGGSGDLSFGTPDISSEDENEIIFPNDDQYEPELSSVLGSWVVRNRCTRSVVNELLSILKAHGHPDLPNDQRTLLQTPDFVTTQQKCGCDYVYFGIETGIIRTITEYETTDITVDNFDVQVFSKFETR